MAGWLLLLLTTAVVYRPAVPGAGAFEAWDQARVYVPLQVSNARQRSDGEIPLWFRHGFLGYPLQGENECSGVYPPAAVVRSTRASSSPPTTNAAPAIFDHPIGSLSQMVATVIAATGIRLE